MDEPNAKSVLELGYGSKCISTRTTFWFFWRTSIISHISFHFRIFWRRASFKIRRNSIKSTLDTATSYYITARSIVIRNMFSIDMKMTSMFVASMLLLIAMSSSTTTPVSAVVTTSNQRVMTKKYKWELDSAAMLSKSTFKIKPAQLIERCKEVIDKNIGLDKPSDLAEDFAFQFPVIGPLSKTAYLE